MDPDYDFVPAPRGRGRTTVNQTASLPSDQPINGLVANGLWRPGELPEAPRALRRPMKIDQDAVVPEAPPSKPRAEPKPPASAPSIATVNPMPQQSELRRRSQLSPSAPAFPASGHSQPDTYSPWQQYIDNAAAHGRVIDSVTGLFVDTTLPAAIAAQPLSPDAKPFSPDAKSFSSDAKSFSPDAKPFSPDAKPFSPHAKPIWVPAVASPSLDVSSTSALSVDAKEFVPRRRVQHEAQDYRQAAGKNLADEYSAKRLEDLSYHADYDTMSPGDYGGPSDYGSPSDYGGPRDCGFGLDVDVTPEEVAMNHLTEVMAHLTMNPGSFDAMVAPLVDAFGSWLEDEETVCAVVDAIFEQSIADANFRFNGARICNKLNNKFESRFRNHLLTTCRREHERVFSSAQTDPSRAHGYVLFVADLFVTLELVRGLGQKIDILGKALIEAVALLLTRPDNDNVKCVCQALKLSGYHLNATKREELDSIFDRLRSIQEDDRTAAKAQLLIMNVMDLRRDNWGIAKPASAAQRQSHTPPAIPPNFGPVFYGPDGHILSAEERQFLQDQASASAESDDAHSYRDEVFWEPDNVMDDEIQAAFEQFLSYGKTKPRQ